jgi:hypothetical protein
VQGVDRGAFFNHQAAEDGGYILCEVTRDGSFGMRLMALELHDAPLGLSCEPIGDSAKKDVLAPINARIIK